MHFSTLSTILAITSLAAGLPASPCPGAPPAASPPTAPAPPASSPSAEAPPASPPAGSSALADVILAIDPKTAECDASADFADECAPASKAGPAIEASYTKYEITNANEKAAILALIILESGSFKYNRNHFPEPGRPGQGTRNMQSAEFNKKYAEAVLGADDQTLQEASAKEGDEGLNAVLALVNTDELSFASAAWFYSSQCSEEVKKQMQEGAIEGFHAYMGECVGTENTDARDEGYTAAKEAFEKAGYQ